MLPVYSEQMNISGELILSNSVDSIHKRLCLRYPPCKSTGFETLSNISKLEDNSTEEQVMLHETYLAMAFIYPIVSIITVIGNLLVIFIILRLRHMRRSFTNFFLFNMAISDLCVGIICINQTYYELVNPSFARWTGPVMCKMNHFVQLLAQEVSIFILITIAIERYMAITAPMRLLTIRSKSIYISILVFVWVFSFILALPNFFAHHIEPKTLRCMRRYSFFINHMVYFQLTFTMLYLIPVLLMTGLYSHICYILWRSTIHFRVNFKQPQQPNIPLAIKHESSTLPEISTKNKPHSYPGTNFPHTSVVRETNSLPLMENRAFKVNKPNCVTYQAQVNNYHDIDLGHKGTSGTRKPQNGQNNNQPMSTNVCGCQSKRCPLRLAVNSWKEEPGYSEPSDKYNENTPQTKDHHNDVITKIAAINADGQLDCNNKNNLQLNYLIRDGVAGESRFHQSRRYFSTSTQPSITSKRAIRSRKRLIIMLMVQLFVFALCKLPKQLWSFNIYLHLNLFYNTLNGYYFTIVGHLFLYLISAINPIIYFTFSSSFRRGFCEVFKSKKKLRHNRRRHIIV